MTPIFFVFMLVCTKAWVDGLLGRPYSWVKTARSSWSALDGSEGADGIDAVAARGGGMNARRLSVVSALVIALVVAFGGFHLFNGAGAPARGVASSSASLAPIGDRATVVNGHVFQLLPPDQLRVPGRA